jgi:hypothetical protein
MPLLQQLRFLRTLPVSATRLALVMFATVLLPLIAMGALAASVAGMFLGPSEAFTVLNSFTLALAPAALCVFFAVWRGDRMEVYAFLLLTMLGFLLGPMYLRMLFHYPEHSINLTGLVVCICFLSAFLLTRRVILHSSRAYRVRPNAGGNLPWGAGR